MEINKQTTRGAMIRARARYANLAEKPTKYFLSLEKANCQKKMIYRLENDIGEIIDNEKAILNEIRNFYDRLYSSCGEVDLSYLQKLNLPQLPQDIKDELDKDITITEIGDLLSELQNGKWPGADGLDASFYKMFWSSLKEPMYNAYTEIISKGLLHLSARQSVISLLEKVDKCPLKLQSWRPLCILNTDNKIYSKLLARCMQKATDFIIHSAQQGFIKGRHMAENLIKIQEIMQKCDDESINAFLISFDFLKAFDMLENEAMFAALRAFNFGEKFINMTKILYNQPVAYATNNDFWSPPIYPTRSCRQGCCYLPVIFIITVELLGIALRQNEKN